mgnify:CR=1 FL=1
MRRPRSGPEGASPASLGPELRHPRGAEDHGPRLTAQRSSWAPPFAEMFWPVVKVLPFTSHETSAAEAWLSGRRAPQLRPRRRRPAADAHRAHPGHGACPREGRPDDGRHRHVPPLQRRDDRLVAGPTARLSDSEPDQRRRLQARHARHVDVEQDGPRVVGGEIFSNVKAGMVHPLFVELKHSWSLPGILSRTACTAKPFHPTSADGYSEARIMPNCGRYRRIARLPTQL